MEYFVIAIIIILAVGVIVFLNLTAEKRVKALKEECDMRINNMK